MGSVNKVILVGNLGRDAELRYTPGGAAVATINMATTEVWNDKGGQRQEKTEWHRVVLWGKPAESLTEYLTKGKQIYVEGRLQTRQWDDKDGNKRYTTEIRGDKIVLLGGAAAAAATEQDDLVAANLRRVPLVAVLVVPLPGLQPSLDVNLLPLGEVFGERFGRLAPQHHAVPFGFFLALAALVVPHLGRGHVDGGDGRAAWRVAQFRVAPEIAYQNDFVDAAHCARILASSRARRPSRTKVFSPSDRRGAGSQG